jgi:hypothetical protein
MIKEKNVIQWLENKITGLSIQLLDGYLTITEFMEEQNNIFKEAKEMTLDNIDRFEVIDHTKELKGRCYVKHNCKVEESIQDYGKTLKIFVTDKN